MLMANTIVENQIVVFKDGALELDVKITPEQDTVWLTQAQMVEWGFDSSILMKGNKELWDRK